MFYDKQNNYFPDKVRFHVEDEKMKIKAKYIVLDLQGTRGKRLWRSVASGDVAALKIPKKKIDGCMVIPLNKKYLLPGAEDLGKVPSGAPIYVVGYPHGRWTGEYSRLPIIRAGIISTPLSMPLERGDCFLIDANLAPGMSGSPVLIDKKQIEGNLKNIPPVYLLGIFSDEWIFELKQTGLNTVWHAKLIKRLVR